MTYRSARGWLTILMLWATFCLGVPSAYAAAGDVFSVQDYAGDAFRVDANRNAIVPGGLNVTGTATVDNCTVNGTVNTPTVNATTVTATRIIPEMVLVNATNYSIPTAHAAVYAVVNGNAQNLTLPNPALLPDGDPIKIVDMAGQAASNTIAVNSTNTTGAGNVNNVAFVNITAAYAAKTYVAKGGKWFAY